MPLCDLPAAADSALRLLFPPQPSERALTGTSATAAFDTGINKRDGLRCVVCGFYANGSMVGLEHAHIVPQSDEPRVSHHQKHHLIPLIHSNCQWTLLKLISWIPQITKSVAHDPRNGIMMCATHHALFDHLHFFIRWRPEVCRNPPSLAFDHANVSPNL